MDHSGNKVHIKHDNGIVFSHGMRASPDYKRLDKDGRLVSMRLVSLFHLGLL